VDKIVLNPGVPRAILIDLPRLYTDERYIDQLDAPVRAAVLGNAGALLVFRVSGYDAQLLASEFDPLPPSTLIDQAPYTAWLRRGIGHEHVELLPRLFKPGGRLDLIRGQSRRNFGRAQAHIEKGFL